jgi:hypothetical protein
LSNQGERIAVEFKVHTVIYHPLKDVFGFFRDMDIIVERKGSTLSTGYRFPRSLALSATR